MYAVNVISISKIFKYYKSPLSRFLFWISQANRYKPEIKYVLSDVSFKVNQGEALAIVGVNGAGKSTLLKILSGTLKPSNGEIHCMGRVSSLLELGLGFHADFTGRQNVYFSGQALGFSNYEIHSLMSEIESFAEIGEYIDRPVRTYSTGMQARLAFSIITSKRPDVLVIDEVLSVGDAYFQHKSFDRIRNFKKLGTTIVFVSHDKAAILGICDRAIFLSNGKVAMEGEPAIVMDYYNANLSNGQDISIRQELDEYGRVKTISGTGDVSFIEIALLDEDSALIELVKVGQKAKLKVVTKCNNAIEQMVLGYMIKNKFGQPIFGTNTYHHQSILKNLRKDQVLKFIFDFEMNLGPGNYSIAIAAHEDSTHISNNYEWKDHAVFFDVVNSDKDKFLGAAWIPPRITISYE